MRKPNFFVVGARRSGSTALYNYLKRHPDIYMSRRKELHFFGTDIFLRDIWWNSNVNKYLRFFKSVTKEKMVGEDSPHYLFSKKAPQEIKKFAPDAKIVILLRSPVEQIYSSYKILFYVGIEKHTSFEKALMAEKDVAAGKFGLDPFSALMLRYCYIARYSEQVKRYIKMFGKKNIHIIIFEEFRSNTPEVYKNLLKFLGVDSNFTLDFKKINSKKIKNSSVTMRFPLVHSIYRDVEFYQDRINSLRFFWRFRLGDKAVKLLKKVDLPGKDKPPSKKAIRIIMKNVYSDIRKLEKIINKDLSHWYKPYM